MNIKEKIQSMSAKEIIMAMVDGLKNPITEIDMSTYGNVIYGVCYGCAATNTICNLMNITKEDFIKANPKHTSKYLFLNEDDKKFVGYFESAIDCLRTGYIQDYNTYAKIRNFATIIGEEDCVPMLSNDYTDDDLQKYIDLANKQ